MRSRRPRLLAARVGVTLALALVASCSSTTDGHPSQATAASKSSLPARAWNEQIFLCVQLSSSPCQGETTDAELTAIRAQLAADPTVTHVQFVSELDIVKVARLVLPSAVSNTLEVGELPAEFLVSTSGLAGFAARYRADPGVSTVIGCAVANRCAVSTLRAAGVVH